MKTLVIAETTGQARTAVELPDPDMTILGISANLDWWARSSEAQVVLLEDIVDELSLYHHSLAVFDRVDRIVAHVDSIMHEITAAYPHASVISLGAFFHYLKGVYDGLVLRVEQLDAALTALQPESLLCFRMPPYRISGPTSLDRPAWGLSSHLAPLMAATRGIPVDWLDHPGDDPSVIAPQPTAVAPHSFDALNTPVSAPQYRTLLPRLLAKIQRSLPSFIQPNSPAAPTVNGPVLITSIFADLGNEISALWHDVTGGRVMPLGEAFPAAPPDEEMKAFCSALWTRLESDADFRALFLWRQIDLLPFMAEQIHMIIVANIPPLLALASAMGERDLTEPPYDNAVILAGGWVDSHNVIAKIANRSGIPTVSLHYGGFLGYSHLPKHERYDLAECDYFLCGGPGAADNFRLPVPGGVWPPHMKRARPVATGMPWVQAIANDYLGRPALLDSMPSARRRVMLVLNAFLGDCRDFGNTFLPEQGYWRWLEQVAEILAAQANIDVIVKPPLLGRYPQLESPIFDWLEKRKPAHFSVLHEVPLKDCLNKADAFILESPSTPLLHVVATRKPLMLYVDRRAYRLTASAEAALKRRCGIFSDNSNDFLSALPEFLNRGDWLQGCDDDTFLRDFAIGHSDRNSTIRVCEFLQTVVQHHPLSDAKLASISAAEHPMMTE